MENILLFLYVEDIIDLNKIFTINLIVKEQHPQLIQYLGMMCFLSSAFVEIKGLIQTID